MFAPEVAGKPIADDEGLLLMPMPDDSPLRRSPTLIPSAAGTERARQGERPDLERLIVGLAIPRT